MILVAFFQFFNVKNIKKKIDNHFLFNTQSVSFTYLKLIHLQNHLKLKNP